MSCEFIQKSKILISAIAFSILLQSSGALEAAPPKPEFDVSKIEEQLMSPSLLGPIHRPIYERGGSLLDPLAKLTASLTEMTARRKSVITELQAIVPVYKDGHLIPGNVISEDKKSLFSQLSQENIDLKYNQTRLRLEEEYLSECVQISELLQNENGQKYFGYLQALSETLPNFYDLKGNGYSYVGNEESMPDNLMTPDDNLMVLIGGKKQGKTTFSLEFLREEMRALEADLIAHPPAGVYTDQYRRSPKALLNGVLHILGTSSSDVTQEVLDAAQKTLDDMTVWMSAFKDFSETTTETTRYQLKTLRLEKKNLLKDNADFMKRLDVVPANIPAVEPLMKEAFVTKVNTLEAEILRKEEIFIFLGKVSKYLLDIEEYLSKHGKVS